MNQQMIPQELTNLITSAEWDRSGIIGHKSTIIEYPENTQRLLEKKIFSFEELTRFEWQELQALLINIDAVEELISFEYEYDTPLFPMKLLAIGDVCVDCGTPRVIVMDKLKGRSRLTP